MSGRARLTVCAAAAAMMAATALLPLTDNAGWYFRTLLLVCLQAAVGAGARRIPLARPLTLLAQAVVSLLALTVMFASRQALGGIVPGPSALRALGQVVQDGMNDVSDFAIPAPVTPGIKILLVGGVLLVALAVDAIAVTYDSAAPAGLPLLALYSIAAGLHEGGTAWLYFVVAGAGYLLLLLAEGRDRLSRWGRVFGGPPAAGNRAGGSGAAGAPVRAGRRIGAMALGIALLVPVLLPSLGSGLLNTSGTGGGGGGGHGGGTGSVNLVAALQDNLNQPDDREVLRYRTDAGDVPGTYLRIAALDTFDGKEWTASDQGTQDVPAHFPRPDGMSDAVKYKPVVTEVQVTHDYVQGALPMPFPALSVQVPGRWKFAPESRMLIGEGGQTTADLRYTVTSMAVAPTPAQLSAAPPATGRIAERYTQVPDSLPPVVAKTAAEVTKDATNDYERALALQRYFTSGAFVYNTHAEAGSGVDAIARFLQTKEGFCVHFAFTMAAMARTLHIPARVAIGFQSGTQTADGTMSVGLKDAHAWPELYFQGIGWTRFEPTPYRGSEPSYTLSSTPGGGSDQQELPPHSGATTAPAVPRPTSTCAAGNRVPADCGQAAAGTNAGSGGGGIGAGRLALIALIALLLLAVPSAPLLWRRRLRARRLGGAGGQQPALAAWREMVDTAWDYGVLPDESETPRRATARLVADGRLDDRAAASAVAVATAVEQTLYAARPHTGPVPGLAEDVHRVRAGLRASAGRRRRLRAALLPRSAARLGWSLSARWNALAARVSARVGRLTALLRRAGRTSPSAEAGER
jgi:transglutaminase-like putative cysteine protease